VQEIATRDLGIAVVAIGGGRTRPEDAVDHAVGLTAIAGIGERVDGARPLAIVHARTEAHFEAAAAALRRAYRLGDESVSPAPLIAERIGAGG
jgi:thymidine phosphorylase